MSLRSGKSYLRDYSAERGGEAGGEAEVADRRAAMQQPSQLFDTRSHTSRASRSSQRSSSTTSSATKAYAKAKAAKAQLAFVEKEADMMRQKSKLEAEKADLDASIHILRYQREVAAAEAEASVYEEAEFQSGEFRKELHVEAEPSNTAQRTSEYVQYQSALLCPDTFSHHTAVASSERRDNKPDLQHGAATTTLGNSPHVNIKQEAVMNTHLIGTYQHNLPAQTLNPPHGHTPAPDGAQDFARYLIRKEIVSTGLLQFDDKPENYWAWKASFVSATKDLNLSAREELDLLTKWLGPKSSEQAKRIRAVHTLDPSAGSEMVWQRLEECYGSPEVIEDALLRKVEAFPKLTNKDNVKLRELSDILLELECAKQDGALPGLAYLDTARGVRQIVEKLPFNLQERWTIVGTQYKDVHCVSFPPFSVFTQFIQQQAKMKNDPSFIISNPSSSHVSPHTEKSPSYNRRVTVSAHRTDIVANTFENSPETKKMEEPDRECPIHKKPHPLKKCKLFRDKPIEERKAYLKEHRICYRCCGSVQHVAKECKAVIRCTECDSTKHIAALHPDPVPAPKNIKPESQYKDSGERSENTPSVTSTCTEVCGESNSPRSCSKISLVNVYPAGKKEEAVKMYAVIDEQSNRSLAKSEFFDLFDINSRAEPYTLKTCSGRVQTSGRRAVNFFIESIDGKVNVQLPPLIECDSVPDDRMEIPSPEIALHHPHLFPVADKIQPVDHQAPILLLLGRDILRVHKVREQINGPSNTPYAQRLDLGWVIVGDVCLGKVHKSSQVNVYKTHTLEGGRVSYFEPCPNVIHVKENSECSSRRHSAASPVCMHTADIAQPTDTLGHSVFDRTRNDDKFTLSIEDKTFLAVMDNDVYQNKENSWVAPLPFHCPRRRLPNNREPALKRLRSLQRTLERKPKMKDHYIQFVQKMSDLPTDRVTPEPPFTSVGMDVFGPWTVVQKTVETGSEPGRHILEKVEERIFVCLTKPHKMD